MLCPYCQTELPEASRFCGHCGRPLENAGLYNAPPQTPPQDPAYLQAVNVPYNDKYYYNKYFMPAQRKRWRPWMTVLICCVVAAALSVAGWASLFHALSGAGSPLLQRIEEQIDRYPAANKTPQTLLRTWIQTGYDYYTGEEYLLELTITEENISMTYRTAAGTEDYGTYRYYLTDDGRIYLPELRESYEYSLNENENMLTISPGIFTEWEEENWFNFEY